jgi:hypothetical protein
MPASAKKVLAQFDKDCQAHDGITYAYKFDAKNLIGSGNSATLFAVRETGPGVPDQIVLFDHAGKKLATGNADNQGTFSWKIS